MVRSEPLGVRSVLVIAWLAIEAAEDEKDKHADKRDERDQPPPAALPDIVHTADKHGKTGNQNSKIINHAKKRKQRNTRRARKKSADKTNYQSSDEVEKHEQPVFLTASAAREASIFLGEAVNVVVHREFTPFYFVRHHA